MLKHSIPGGLAAVALIFMSNIPGADAGVTSPRLTAKETVQAPATNVGWMCGERRCFWRPDYAGPVPPFAAAWGPPDYPTCYYVQRRISKRWRQICPEIPWQAR